MTTITHILVDFENVQPGAADIALLHGEGLRLAIFRGPGQMKYAADLAEAWQPLGASVQFVRCAKAGRNAVDMHIAYHLGTLIDAHRHAGAGEALRLVVVSRDTDFDPLLLYIRGQGYDALRVPSIRAAIGGRDAGDARPAKKSAPRAAPAEKSAARAPAAPRSAARKTPAKKAAPAGKSAPPVSARKSATPTTAARKTAALTRTPTPTPARAPSPRAAAPDARARVIESLQHMGDKRPSKRKGLERHVESHLGRNLAPGALQALLEQLERDGVLVFTDNKVEYRLPKARK